MVPNIGSPNIMQATDLVHEQFIHVSSGHSDTTSPLAYLVPQRLMHELHVAAQWAIG